MLKKCVFSGIIGLLDESANLKFADKIYLHEQDKKMSLKSMPFTMLFFGRFIN